MLKYIFLVIFVLVQCDASMLNCNEAICASIVSKCMLTQSCKCDAKNSTCSRDCFHCLDYLFTECCSCVEMCKKSDETDDNLSKKSHVELLSEPSEHLFSVLTEEKDRLNRWVSFTYPSKTTFISNDKVITMTTVSTEKGPEEEAIELNCTVLFLTSCLPYNKCKAACQSMGATSYRWFHDGCCECVGSNCLNYGIQESRCTECPPKEENLETGGTDNEDGSSNKADDEEDDERDRAKENPKEATENTAVIDNLQNVDGEKNVY